MYTVGASQLLHHYSTWNSMTSASPWVKSYIAGALLHWSETGLTWDVLVIYWLTCDTTIWFLLGTHAMCSWMTTCLCAEFSLLVCLLKAKTRLLLCILIVGILLQQLQLLKLKWLLQPLLLLLLQFNSSAFSFSRIVFQLLALLDDAIDLYTVDTASLLFQDGVPIHIYEKCSVAQWGKRERETDRAIFPVPARLVLCIVWLAIFLAPRLVHACN